MKKINVWGLGVLVALGFSAYLMMANTGWAVIGGPLDPNNAGEPGDQMSDDFTDRAGEDRNRDRTPDGDGEGTEPGYDRVEDETEDCVANASGAGGSRGSGDAGNDCQATWNNHTDSGDSTPENQYGDGESNGSTFADGTSVLDGVPDASRYIVLDRALEGSGNKSGDQGAPDFTPDWIYSDTYLARVGRPTSGGDGEPDGGRPFYGNGVNSPTMRPHDAQADGDGAGGNPDNLRPHYGYGPGDKHTDSTSDQGGLALRTSSGGGGGGCSMVATRTATTGTGMAYLLLMLAPAAFVVIRRAVSRR
jgi:hypothetical protein